MDKTINSISTSILSRLWTMASSTTRSRRKTQWLRGAMCRWLRSMCLCITNVWTTTGRRCCNPKYVRIQTSHSCTDRCRAGHLKCLSSAVILQQCTPSSNCLLLPHSSLSHPRWHRRQPRHPKLRLHQPRSPANGSCPAAPPALPYLHRSRISKSTSSPLTAPKAPLPAHGTPAPRPSVPKLP